MNRSTYQFCNNCGKQGHLFNQCNKPIISSGVIAFRRNKGDANEFEYLMICRKDSLGYIDFLRGKYPLYSKSYILTLINEMTTEEKGRLFAQTFEDLWKHLWGDFIGIQYRGEERNAKEKFIQIKRGIQVCDGSGYDLESLIEESTTAWETPEWGFPKGRRNYQENDVACALREFEEETGYEKNTISLIKNLLPFDEIFIGSNLKSYKHVYFLGHISNTITPSTAFQKSEVSQMNWFTLDECKKRIRIYDIEKLQLIDNINNVLQSYRLIS